MTNSSLSVNLGWATVKFNKADANASICHACDDDGSWPHSSFQHFKGGSQVIYGNHPVRRYGHRGINAYNSRLFCFEFILEFEFLQY